MIIIYMAITILFINLLLMNNISTFYAHHLFDAHILVFYSLLNFIYKEMLSVSSFLMAKILYEIVLRINSILSII